MPNIWLILSSSEFGNLCYLCLQLGFSLKFGKKTILLINFDRNMVSFFEEVNASDLLEC